MQNGGCSDGHGFGNLHILHAWHFGRIFATANPRCGGRVRALGQGNFSRGTCTRNDLSRYSVDPVVYLWNSNNSGSTCAGLDSLTPTNQLRQCWGGNGGARGKISFTVKDFLKKMIICSWFKRKAMENPDWRLKAMHLSPFILHLLESSNLLAETPKYVSRLSPFNVNACFLNQTVHGFTTSCLTIYEHAHVPCATIGLDLHVSARVSHHNVPRFKPNISP